MEPWRSAAVLLAVSFLGLAYVTEWRRRHELVVAWDRWAARPGDWLHRRAWGVLAWLCTLTSLAVVMGLLVERLS